MASLRLRPITGNLLNISQPQLSRKCLTYQNVPFRSAKSLAIKRTELFIIFAGNHMPQNINNNTMCGARKMDAANPAILILQPEKSMTSAANHMLPPTLPSTGTIKKFIKDEAFGFIFFSLS